MRARKGLRYRRDVGLEIIMGKGHQEAVMDGFRKRTCEQMKNSLNSKQPPKVSLHLLDSRTPVFEIEFAYDGVTCVILDKNDYMVMRNKAAYSFMPEEI